MLRYFPYFFFTYWSQKFLIKGKTQTVFNDLVGTHISWGICDHWGYVQVARNLQEICHK